MLSGNKRIVKNTGLLYLRMLFTMVISLYTSRVVLDVLGVDDFGIYQVVAGVVGMLSFVNTALATATSRFLTYELGKNKFTKLRKVFSTTLTIHLFLAFLILIFAETIGLWFLHNKLLIPAERMKAAIWAYHLSILTAMVSITQVPYNASIIAHERMNIYAYVSILEVILKLLIVYLLSIVGVDKLVFYAMLMFLVTLMIAMIYRIYCIKNYNECRYKLYWDKTIFKSIIGFSTWSLFSNLSIALVTQGATLVLNMFFNPAIIASRAIAVQVNNAINQFTNNFRIAVNPQIIKSFAVGDVDRMKTLVRNSTQFTFYLLLFLELPVFLTAPYIISFWLGQIPDYSILFLRLTLIYTLLTSFDTSLYIVFNAMGRLKENAIWSPSVSIWIIPITYIFYKFGFPVETLFYIQIIKALILSFIIKPCLLVKYADYGVKEVYSIFLPCIKVMLLSLIFPLGAYYLIGQGGKQFIWLIIFSLTSVSITAIYVGISKNERNFFYSFIISKIRKKQI